MKFSTLAETIQPSEILAVSERANEQLAKGKQIFNLTVGDFNPSYFPIPKEMEADIIQAYRDHLTNYPAAEGNIDLRDAIRQYTCDFQELEYSREELLVASGGRPLIYATFMALCDRSDRVVFPVPSWNNNYYTHFAGADAILVETSAENHFMPTAKDLEPLIKDATLIVLCSPQNPTGIIFGRKELKAICELILSENQRRSDQQKKCFLLFDQLYSQLIYGGERHYHPLELCSAIRPYLVTVDAISKCFAATGVRVGWCMAPADLISKMKIILTQMGAWAPMPEQIGLSKFLLRKNSLETYLSKFRFELYTRLKYVYTQFCQLKEQGYPVDSIKPQAAIYVSLKIDLIKRTGKDGTILRDTSDVTGYLLEKARLAIIPFQVFGASRSDGWYRLSVGTCNLSDLESMMFELKKSLENFKSIVPVSAIKNSTKKSKSLF